MRLIKEARREFLKASVGGCALLANLPFKSFAQTAADGSRVALVIGNDKYRSAPLENAVNDAQAMRNLLSQAEFGVTLQTDAAREQLMRAIQAFGTALADSKTNVGWFYFAGHAVQLEWRNYLLPVDAEVKTADDIKRQCVDLGSLLAALPKAKGKTAVIILDACRDNPFGDTFRPDQKGLSQFDAPVGTLLAFATHPGGLAADGLGGKNGLYTEHLVRELSVKGVRIEDALKRVRLNVRIASGGRQIPWESTSLENDVFLFAAPKLSEAELEKQIREDIGAWERIKNSKKLDDWVEYLRKFPNGRFAEIAQVRMNDLAATPPPAIVATAEMKPKYVLGEGLPVPDFFGPQKTPYSSGRHPINRTWTVGDEVVWRLVDRFSRVEIRRGTNRVTRVVLDADRVEIDDGAVVRDTLGNYIKFYQRTFNIVPQVVPAELQVGKKWLAAGQVTQPQGTFDFYYEMKIARIEKVKVPAGDFEAFLLEGSGYSRGPFNNLITTSVWIVPGVSWIIKRETSWYSGSRLAHSEDVELVSLKQYR